MCSPNSCEHLARNHNDKQITKCHTLCRITDRVPSFVGKTILRKSLRTNKFATVPSSMSEQLLIKYFVELLVKFASPVRYARILLLREDQIAEVDYKYYLINRFIILLINHLQTEKLTFVSEKLTFLS